MGTYHLIYCTMSYLKYDICIRCYDGKTDKPINLLNTQAGDKQVGNYSVILVDDV